MEEYLAKYNSTFFLTEFLSFKIIFFENLFLFESGNFSLELLKTPQPEKKNKKKINNSLENL